MSKTWNNCLSVSVHLLNIALFFMAAVMAAQGILGLLYQMTGQINVGPTQPVILYLFIANAGLLMFSSLWIVCGLCYRQRWMLIAYWIGQACLFGLMIAILVIVMRYNGASAQFWNELAASFFSVKYSLIAAIIMAGIILFAMCLILGGMRKKSKNTYNETWYPAQQVPYYPPMAQVAQPVQTPSPLSQPYVTPQAPLTQPYVAPQPQQTGSTYIDYVVEEKVTSGSQSLPERNSYLSQSYTPMHYHSDPLDRRSSGNNFDFTSPYGSYNQGFRFTPPSNSYPNPSTLSATVNTTGGLFVDDRVKEDKVQVYDHYLTPVASATDLTYQPNGSEVMLNDPVREVDIELKSIESGEISGFVDKDHDQKKRKSSDKPLPPIVDRDEFGIKVPQ